MEQLHYAVKMLEMAGEAESYAGKRDSFLEAGKVVEVAPDLWITWVAAIHYARCKAEEYKAMA